MLFSVGAAAPVSPARLALSAFAAAAASCVTHAAAWAVSLRRPLVRLPLSDDECEEQGLPLGATLPAVSLLSIRGAQWWRFDAWIEAEDGGPERCLCLRLLGWEGQVFYLSRDVAHA